MADKLKIPFAYFERMRNEQASLLDRNVDTWLHHEPELRMVRTLDGQARAFLSDRYRRLDNYDLCEHVLPMLQRLPDARFESTELTPTRLYLKVVTPRVQIEIQPGDIVQAGVVISNSEVGQGTLSVQPAGLPPDLPQRPDRGRPRDAQDARGPHERRPPTWSRCSGTTRCRPRTRPSSSRSATWSRPPCRKRPSSRSPRRCAARWAPPEGRPGADHRGRRDPLPPQRGRRSGLLRHLIEGSDLSAYGLVMP